MTTSKNNEQRKTTTKTYDKYYCRNCEEYHYFIVGETLDRNEPNYKAVKCSNCGWKWWLKVK
jgi:RNase P subunit RPR2